MNAGSIQWSTINRKCNPELDPVARSLEDAAVAAVTRLQEDLPTLTMIPPATAAVDSSMGGYSR
jgi:hypothetical protein